MTKKNYIAIAAILAVFSDVQIAAPAADVTEVLAEHMASYFATDNPNFDRERFLTACGF